MSAARSNSCSAAACCHALFELALDLPVTAGEEIDDRLDVRAVVVLRDVADAGCLAALYVVVEAGVAGRAAGLRPLAGSVGEELAEQVERLAHALGAREGAEVGARRDGGARV